MLFLRHGFKISMLRISFLDHSLLIRFVLDFLDEAVSWSRTLFRTTPLFAAPLKSIRSLSAIIMLDKV